MVGLRVLRNLMVNKSELIRNMILGNEVEDLLFIYSNSSYIYANNFTCPSAAAAFCREQVWLLLLHSFPPFFSLPGAKTWRKHCNGQRLSLRINWQTTKNSGTLYNSHLLFHPILST